MVNRRRGSDRADLAGRAAIHAALAEPNRLRILDALTASDLAPGELARSLDLAPNLLAHHLDSLESVGLVRRVRSAGDRRRRYVTLTAQGVGFSAGTVRATPRRPLFVCTHNSARSQLAAALWRHHTGFAAPSAGTHPAERVHPGAIAAAARVGLDLTDARPRLLDGRPHGEIVTVCDRAHEELEPVAVTTWHWSLPDPADPNPEIDFDEVVTELARRIGHLTDLATTSEATDSVERGSP